MANWVSARGHRAGPAPSLAKLAELQHRFGQFLHEQRHAVGLCHDLLEHFGRKRLAARDAIDQRHRVTMPKRVSESAVT